MIATLAAVAILIGVAVGGAEPPADSPTDVPVSNETTLYQGQTAVVSLTAIEDDVDAISLVDANGSTVREYAIADTVRIESTHLPADSQYTLQGVTKTQNGLVATGNQSDRLILERYTHSLEASFAHNERTALEGDSSQTTLAIDSDRPSVPITLYADGLSGEELAKLIDEADLEAVTETNVTLANHTARVDVEGLEPGEYEFLVNATDTTASDTATLTVTDDTTLLSFDQRVVETPPLGVGSVTVDLEHAETAFVQIGNESAVNYEVVLELTDRDGNGEVTVQIDTSRAGAVPQNASERCDGLSSESGPESDFDSGSESNSSESERSPVNKTAEGTAMPTISGPDADRITVSGSSAGTNTSAGTDTSAETETDCVFDESAAFSAVGNDSVTVHSVTAGELPNPLDSAEYELSLALTDEIDQTEQDVGTLRIS